MTVAYKLLRRLRSLEDDDEFKTNLELEFEEVVHNIVAVKRKSEESFDGICRQCRALTRLQVRLSRRRC